jgi:cellulose synthase/poly-beta-1,6-N-acetylglucosamine synthase-like glycosyltransferase
MVISPWHDVVVAYRDRKFKYKIKTYNPRVSVMIPAWNEETGILHTVDTILKSTYKKIQIVIINDGSTDGSDKVVREYLKKYEEKTRHLKRKVEIVYVYKENGGKGAALNTAIQLSKGDILVSIDADCIVLPETIRNFVTYFADKKVMAAVGNVKVGNTNKLIGAIQHIEFMFSFYFKKADSVMNTIYIIGGAAGAFRRETLEKVGVYNTSNITEDIELSVRIQRAGMKIVYAADALVYTEGASRLRDLMKQRLRWKRGRFETFFEHKSLFFSTRPEHNKFLSWVILPLAYFGEVQLAFELLFLIFIYIYSYLNNDFSSFISGMVVVGSMFAVQMFFDDQKTKRASYYLLVPIGWMLLYLTTYVEWTALIKSIWGLVRKKELKWQKWQRQGVHGS